MPATCSDDGKRHRLFFKTEAEAKKKVAEPGKTYVHESAFRADLALRLRPYGATLGDAVDFFVASREQAKDSPGGKSSVVAVARREGALRRGVAGCPR